jgi:hypothetical protein
MEESFDDLGPRKELGEIRLNGLRGNRQNNPYFMEKK